MPDMEKLIEKYAWPISENISGMTDDVVRQHFREFADEVLRAQAQSEPVAFRVHDFHLARQPVKAKGKFPEPTEFLYPASRETDARDTARIMGGECTPLYEKWKARAEAAESERDFAKGVSEMDTALREAAETENSSLRALLTKVLAYLEGGNPLGVAGGLRNSDLRDEVRAALAGEDGQ